MAQRTSVGKSYKRAHSSEERKDRMGRILAAAESLIASSGWPSFTISALAKEAGIAKGTFYLYFETKDEVLLALYEKHIERWADIFLDRLEPGLTDRDFCREFPVLRRQDPIMSLRVQGYPYPTQEEAVDTMQVARFATRNLSNGIERALGLPKGGGWIGIVALFAFFIGAREMYPDLPERTAVDTDGLRAEDDSSPSLERFFIRHGTAILAGVRASVGGEAPLADSGTTSG